MKNEIKTNNRLIKASRYIAEWVFEKQYIMKGSIEEENIRIKDVSGNGNDLELKVYENVGNQGGTILKWSMKDHKEEKEYLEFLESTQTSKHAYFKTVEDALINNEEFKEGYTIEIMYKLPENFHRKHHAWMKLINREGIGRELEGAKGEKDLLCQLAISNLKELQWTYYPENMMTNPTSWSFTLDSYDEWYHIVLMNDSKKTQVYVNGVTDFRNTEHSMQGIKKIEGKGWEIGAATVERQVTDFLRGKLQHIRIANKALAMNEWLVSYESKKLNDIQKDQEDLKLHREENYTMVFVPDVQKVVRYRSEILETQNKWIAKNTNQYNIAFTAFLGDIVDRSDQEDEWKNADKGISILDAHKIPYLVMAGNHDYLPGEPYLNYFGKERYVDREDYHNDSPSGYSCYSVFHAGSYEYMIVATEWYQSHYEADRMWIKKILTENKNLPTILISHELLEYDEENGNGIGRSHRGERNWQDFIYNNDQVFMTLCGHHHGADYQISQNAYGHDVLELLVDYQSKYHGGNGWMRYVEFDEQDNKMYFYTYSPWVHGLEAHERTYFDQNHLSGEKDQFAYAFNFKERFSFVG